ncbi:MAG TPA: TIM-barrel domain-containing protein [Terriglobales bacterium]|nr:TIM-barrel domain-containing protein [Terriglobales bacterium]
MSSKNLPRRNALKLLGGAIAASCLDLPTLLLAQEHIQIAGREARISISTISPHTARIQIAESGSAPGAQIDDGAVLEAQLRSSTPRKSVTGPRVSIQRNPLTIKVSDTDGKPVQELRVDEESGAVTFLLGDGPILGMGEGGPQFDRRGNLDPMRSGQGGYHLRTYGGRVPIQWMIGTSGWAMFVHQPLATFDLTDSEGKLTANDPKAALPIDTFVVSVKEPAQAMAEYARITGHPEMPPLWSLGYQQSHRTITSRDEILSIARTFREKKLPCDALIYLGTGFCPSGWNTENGSFQFNRRAFPDPKEILDEFHRLNFRVVLHAVILTRTLRGSVHDTCSLPRFDETEVSCYWDAHRKDFALGVDGWWPDEGDPLDAASRLTRNRMYYEGPQLDHPNQRPYALHRNGYAGMQRYAPFLWSGDVYSTWETLRNHIPISINTGLSGIPFWGTDTGGFVPTKEFNGELFVRWFQFSAFCPLFRGHGRDWKLRLPWQWNTGELGPNEISNYGEAANPDPSELHNPDVEPICRKYLELRYRLLPYLYTAVRESHETGLPIIRALWLHYPNDPKAVNRADEYLWGRDILVAPVTEKGATTKTVYLPEGDWYDFWTEEKVTGGREVNRPVDLATIPLYVRAGAILPFGPIKQFTSEKSEEPLAFVVYPGAGSSGTIYEDDGNSFDYHRGEWMKIGARWDGQQKRLSVRLLPGSRMLPPLRRKMEVRLVPEKGTHAFDFSGHPITVSI